MTKRKPNRTATQDPPLKLHPYDPDLTPAQSEESAALRLALAAAALAAIFALWMTRGQRDVWLLGDDNLLSEMILYTALAIALVAAPISYVRGAKWRIRRLPADRPHDWQWRVIPVTVGALFVNFLLVLVALVVINRAFPDLAMSRWAAIITLAMTAGAVTYYTVHLYSNLRAPTMLYVTLSALFGTLLFAGAIHVDAHWFVQSFSHLGATDTNMRFIFNIGIIMSGILLVVWQQFHMDDLIVLQEKALVTPRSLMILRWGLILCAILLSLVGATPWGISTLINVIHMLVAGGSGVVAGILVVAIWWLIPWFPRWFYYTGYALVVVTVIVVALKLADYVWLTGMQFAGFIIIAFWLVLFQKNSENLVQRIDPATKLLAAQQNDAALI